MTLCDYVQISVPEMTYYVFSGTLNPTHFTSLRKVNNCTVPDPFPLQRIEDLIDRVGKAKFLTKLHMTRGY